MLAKPTSCPLPPLALACPSSSSRPVGGSLLALAGCYLCPCLYICLTAFGPLDPSSALRLCALSKSIQSPSPHDLSSHPVQGFRGCAAVQPPADLGRVVPTAHRNFRFGPLLCPRLYSRPLSLPLFSFPLLFAVALYFCSEAQLRAMNKPCPARNPPVALHALIAASPCLL